MLRRADDLAHLRFMLDAIHVEDQLQPAPRRFGRCRQRIEYLAAYMSVFPGTGKSTCEALLLEGARIGSRARPRSAGAHRRAVSHRALHCGRADAQARGGALAAIDFTTVEVWTATGLGTQYVLLVMNLVTRRVELAGITMGPGTEWMKQVARNLTDATDGFLVGKRYLLMDRDASFSAEFREVLKRAGVEPVRIPPRAPNCNPHIERFMLSLKSECLDRMVLFGQESLNRATREYLEHYHRERNHQGLDGKIIDAGPELGRVVGRIRSNERLGGMLRYYYREAA